MIKESERRKFRIRIILALAVLFAMLAFVSIGCASGTTHYVNPGESIQAAVNAADPYDTIIVRDGTYTENVNVNKRLTIQSENGSANCIVQAANSADHVFELTSDYVNISGFTVKNATESAYIYASGIHLYCVDYCNVSNNNCENNYYGIRLDYSNDNSISDNKFSNNWDCIQLWYSNNNSISNNNCSSDNKVSIKLYESNNNNISDNKCLSSRGGIYLVHSKNNKLIGNTMLGNGIFIRGDLLSEYMQEMDTSNTVNGKPVYYWKDVQGGKIPEGAGQIIIVNCSNVTVENHDLNNASVGIEVAFSSSITIKNNNCSNNDEDGIHLDYSNNNIIFSNNCSSNYWFGIRLWYSNNSSISENICSDNNCGISICYSGNNNISDNTCSDNSRGISLHDSNDNRMSKNKCVNNGYSIYLWDSNGNRIYMNNFMNITENVHSFESANIWNSSSKITYTYKGKTYENYMGNYWDDYTGSDADKDGIGDTPYSIDSDNDNYPLMQPWGNYFVPAPSIFDTEPSENPYPSIMGTHKGEIKPSCNINVSKLYTYPCIGTGGHTESIKLYENDTLIASGTWNGYEDDWHNITITPSVTLLAGHTYNYTIVTGSYPQIIHEPSKDVTGGTITCTSFVDANGKMHFDWIPAIRLE